MHQNILEPEPETFRSCSSSQKLRCPEEPKIWVSAPQPWSPDTFLAKFLLSNRRNRKNEDIPKKSQDTTNSHCKTPQTSSSRL